jgi:hypothetical protein
MVVIYEFWRYDLPTELVRDLLYDLGIPYREKVIRLKRKSLEEQPYDEWTRIHIDLFLSMELGPSYTWEMV